MPRAQIKDEKQYQALRREGNSEEKSARIANASAGSSRKKVGKRGGKSPVVADCAQVDRVFQPGREGGRDLVGVVPGPVEPPVHPALHPPSYRGEQGRGGQRGDGHRHRAVDLEHVGG